MVNKHFDQSIFALILFLIFRVCLLSGGDLYKWVDEEGTVHMTDTLSQVPPQYRNQLEKRVLQNTTPEMKPESQTHGTGEKSGAAAGNLKHFEVAYQAFEGTSRRINIPVTFNETVTARLLLDTGSPGLMISPKLADRLGLLDEQDGNLLVMAAGIGGSVPAMLAVVDALRVGEARAEFLPATIARMPSDDWEGLVGMDFIANYKISIDSDRSVLIFDELPPQPDKPGGHDEAWWHSNFQRFSTLRAEWGDFLDNWGKIDLSSSEKERLVKIIRRQYEGADKIYRRLVRYARDNAVPIQWRR